MIVHVRIPPAPLGREKPQRISADDYRAVVDNGEFTLERYECWASGRVLTTVDSLRDLRQRNRPQRAAPSDKIVEDLVRAQGDLIVVSRLLGRVAAGTDSVATLADSIAWLREAADFLEKVANTKPTVTVAP